jgi:hypothetical protein
MISDEYEPVSFFSYVIDIQLTVYCLSLGSINTATYPLPLSYTGKGNNTRGRAFALPLLELLP